LAKRVSNKPTMSPLVEDDYEMAMPVVVNVQQTIEMLHTELKTKRQQRQCILDRLSRSEEGKRDRFDCNAIAPETRATYTRVAEELHQEILLLESELGRNQETPINQPTGHQRSISEKTGGGKKADPGRVLTPPPQAPAAEKRGVSHRRRRPEATGAAPAVPVRHSLPTMNGPVSAVRTGPIITPLTSIRRCAEARPAPEHRPRCSPGGTALPQARCSAPRTPVRTVATPRGAVRWGVPTLSSCVQPRPVRAAFV